ncbi:MAG: bifunctional methylenetetrahydrofolate dehydrogenase/methenyltetrahydrofolate cyclohydrolase FolD [Pseudomonadota bacterium]
MSAAIIDGKANALVLRGEVAREVTRLSDQHSLVPGLAVVLVGEDPASQVYVRNKGRQTKEVGMRSIEHRLDVSTSELDLLALVDKLNTDDSVDGILVQLPLPDHINAQKVIEAIDPSKDVDGFHPLNSGALLNGNAKALVPCTPLGCLLLLRSVPALRLEGSHAVVLGRSNIVGKPVSQLLLQESCTVTTAHSRTRDLPAMCREADILVAAVGRAEMVRGDWIKPGATVIDVGINRIEASAGEKATLVGDVHYEEALAVAGAITPVPGGVGPMTIACLLRNTARAACNRRAIESAFER